MAAPLSVSLNVLGTGSDGTEGSLVFSITKHGVYSDDATVVRRYMFNCGEGTQRLCGETGIKLGSLNSMFLTRLDPMNAAGIPGMILALGTCGAPRLDVVGPRGTHRYLTSTASFAKRQYPSLHCAEVGSSDGPTAPSHVAFKEHTPDTLFVDDPYVRVLPLAASLDRLPTAKGTCRLCRHAPPPPAPKPTTAPTPIARDMRVSSAETKFLEWLTAFYAAKDPSKVPYIAVIANKYKGRYDDLRSMLEAKYGVFELPASESSSSSSDDDDDESTDKNEEDAKTDEQPETIETWLRAFYLVHNPAMIPRMASVLRTYEGRDEHLKTMLQTKYAAKRPAPDTSHESECKKTKTTEAAPDRAVFVPPAPTDASPPVDDVLFYILEFKGALPSVVWLVDLPSASWLPFLSYHFTACAAHRPSLVVHFTKSSIAVHPTYTQWVDAHSGSATRHLLFDGAVLSTYDAGRLGFAFTASAQHRLSLFEKAPGLFPLSPAFRSVANAAETHLQLRVKAPSTPASYIFTVAQPGMTYLLRAAKAHQTVGFSYAPSSWTLPTSAMAVPPPPADGHTITFLGTGSAAPSKLRNSSAIYLEYAPYAGMLIDCGEGTYGQLWRQFGTETRARIRDLSCIWLSHKHADHHCGLVRVLYERSLCNARAPLLVIAPDDILQYVTQWRQAWAAPHNVHFVSITAFNQHGHPSRLSFLQRTGFRDLYSVPVQHCYDAYGLILVLADGTKLVYSGDTRPCARLVSQGMHADVLIHEATFEDAMLDDAVKKKHSTVGEAIQVGHDMRARTTLLTHFSQRYPSLPPRASSGVDAAVGFAFDGMRVSLSQRGLADLAAFMRSLAP
ncbi:hypothetical protein, variant [Saprolegnia diclina VS20]|uniref:ribonuclease Z n=1 Tax=Saprolegnia diclina (strain VS20) TaxID=1156394 RepID=T0Q5T1_SAPDV|nr:hypothetical protein, variant [Saprolegnia diclina VS20]EQC33229.1 hypothetical protein, variant [Saprolegnia diclina VS20]|eukprot:XP_008613352.1 hypothetical protein, variant [Saprolegnia diclina VS20]